MDEYDEIQIRQPLRERITALESALQAEKASNAEDYAIQYKALVECDESELSPDALRVRKVLLADRAALQAEKKAHKIAKAMLEGQEREIAKQRCQVCGVVGEGYDAALQAEKAAHTVTRGELASINEALEGEEIEDVVALACITKSGLDNALKMLDDQNTVIAAQTDEIKKARAIAHRLAYSHRTNSEPQESDIVIALAYPVEGWKDERMGPSLAPEDCGELTGPTTPPPTDKTQ